MNHTLYYIHRVLFGYGSIKDKYSLCIAGLGDLRDCCGDSYTGGGKGYTKSALLHFLITSLLTTKHH